MAFGPANPPLIRIRRLEPRCDGEGRTLYFMTVPYDRSNRPDFVTPEHIPEPEKGAGWFECQTVRDGPWMKLKVLRRVEDQ